MYAVARLSSYISRGVYTVSGPFHPFGGAVDIIVVQQPDGSFKSSPWYVKFGKFQGVLKTREKIVKIDVNGVESDFHMYLDHKGEAYFLSEAVGEEELVELIYSPPSSGDETDERTRIGGLSGSTKSGEFDVNGKILVEEIDMGIGKIVTRTNSRRSRIFGLVFGRNSVKERSERGVERVSSLESAEIAADLLDVKWSTNLSTDDEVETRNASKLSVLNTQVEELEMESLYMDEKAFDHPVLYEATAAYDEELGKVSELGFTNTQCLDEVTTTVELDSSKTDDKDIEVSNLEASDVYPTQASLRNAGVHVIEEGSMSDSVLPDVQNLNLAELGVKSCLQSDIESGCNESNGVLGAGLYEEEDRSQYNGGDLISEVNFRPETGAVMTNTNINGLGLLSDENFCEFPSTDAKSSMNETPVNFNQKSSKMESDIGYLATEASNSSSLLLESVAEDQFLFDDIDQLESSGYHFKESIIRSNMDIENHPLASMVENEQEPNDKNYESSVSSDKLVHECPDVTSAVLLEESKTMSNPLSIPRSQNVPVEACLMVESLPNIRSHIENLEIPDVLHPLSCSVDSSSKSLRWPLLGKEGSISLKLDSDSDHDFLKEHPTIGDTWNSKEPAPPFISRMASFDYDHNLEPEGMIAVNKVNQILDVSSDIVAPGGSWRWPFSFRRSGTVGSVQPPGLDDIKISDTENASESSTYVSKDRNMHKDNIVRKKVKSIVPTSEQLASLNLKEGQNVITFTFSTAMLGKQQVDARIYLWKWNARVVVSDVDGTITKSDVLGQFMPLVGKDWSQTGVAHLFSAIEENGYQLLFLSARAISQAYLTRQFLVSLKQDGKALPDGPVVISPDGLFPSLFREVIRRAPHEFKIACLEDIKALFPPDCNPFYAGFGNRDTDEISYVKVGIPKGKIFIINPKGQVAVNRRVDLKSYTSIHALVNGMFPAMSSVGKEEFNSWNYWKMPYAEIDI